MSSSWQHNTSWLLLLLGAADGRKLPSTAPPAPNAAPPFKDSTATVLGIAAASH
jgi:hypothetical protein